MKFLLKNGHIGGVYHLKIIQDEIECEVRLDQDELDDLYVLLKTDQTYETE